MRAAYVTALRSLRQWRDRAAGPREVVYMLYWYKSTNTYACGRCGSGGTERRGRARYFTCFAGTKAQIRTLSVAAAVAGQSGGAARGILLALLLQMYKYVRLRSLRQWRGRAAGPREVFYLLHWYKTTCFTGTKVQIRTHILRDPRGPLTYADVC
jgi:hypothetical protein